jgi:hypothetical protein
MAEPEVVIRRPVHLSPATSHLLAAQFRTAADLDRASKLLPAVHRDYQDALHKPRDLRALVAQRIAHGATDAGRFVAWLGELALQAESCVAGRSPSSAPASGAEAVVHGLAAVVEEVVVGDLEDAVAGIAIGFAERRFKIGGSGAVRDSGERLLEALSRLQSVEETVSSILQSAPEAEQLVRAVELRLNRASSTIRSATVDEFSSFLQSMGWPPPLTQGDREFVDDSHRTNPLLEASDSSLSR